jgi:hypothetical protein
MVTKYDEKGKFFSEVITKLPQAVTIQTALHVIRGDIFVRPEDRLKDELNRDEKFIAVTNATVLNQNGEVLYRCNFLNINCDQVIWIIPDKELAPKE